MIVVMNISIFHPGYSDDVIFMEKRPFQERNLAYLRCSHHGIRSKNRGLPPFENFYVIGS